MYQLQELLAELLREAEMVQQFSAGRIEGADLIFQMNLRFLNGAEYVDLSSFLAAHSEN